MTDVHDSEELRALRRKLYARSSAANSVQQHELSNPEVDVSRNWNLPNQPQPQVQAQPQPQVVTPAPAAAQPTQVTSPVTRPQESVVENAPAAPAPVKRRRRYRTFILIASLLVFIFGVGLSSLYLYMGGNQISSAQIDIDLQGPFTIGGGEVLKMQVSLGNQNTVPIESATLVMKYPPGTRSVGEAPRNLFEERIPIRNIAPNEYRNVPVSVIVFGEEQSEQNISATIEYRIAGSSGTFYKDAEPLKFSISSSPLLVRLESVEKVASGQTVDVTMTLVSNASSPLKDILVSAEYPNGFRFESADPSPVFGQNVWRVDELLPQESKTITLTGVVLGLTEETFRINVDAGPALPDNPFIVGSVLAETGIDFFIERPFINVVTKINGDSNSTHVLEQDETSRVDVLVTNTLEETVYDMFVEVIPGGNVLDEQSISAGSGFYDSNSGTVQWRVANNSTFAVIRPGETRSLSFGVRTAEVQSTAAYDLVVNVYARRVAERSASEQLIGTAQTGVKFSSEIFTGSQVGRNDAGLSDRGPIPPKVGEETTYTLTMVAEAGVNDIVDVIGNASLPVHVKWLNSVEGDGDLVFNPVSKQLEWKAGNILSKARKQVSFQVAITPSTSQVGSSPTLMNSQTLRATDRFTDARLQSSAGPVYTELSTEAGFEEENGKVQR